MFGIFTENKSFKSEFNETVLSASITIGDFKEGMQIPVDYWSIKKYYASWLASLKKGIYEKDNATLLVSMYSPRDAKFLFSWVLYFRQENVIVQNRIIFLDEINNFSIDNINEYTSEYEAYSEGEKVSEWYTTLDEVKEFMSYLESKIS